MRPNIEEIRELAKQVDAENWEHTVLDQSESYITIGYKYENGRHQANWIAEIDNDEKESDEMYAIGEFIVSCAHNIPALLAYIDELENMPLVQTVLKLQEENEGLNELVKDRTNDVIHYDAENKRLLKENEWLNTLLTDRNRMLQDKEKEISRWKEIVAESRRKLMGDVTE